MTSLFLGIHAAGTFHPVSCEKVVRTLRKGVTSHAGGMVVAVNHARILNSKNRKLKSFRSTITMRGC